MTKEEALIYLPVDEENDPQDLYDEKLFELKQFFLNRFPLSKLINSKLLKFEKVEQAFTVFGGKVAQHSSIDVAELPQFDSIHDLYIWYNREKNSLRLRLSAANSQTEVKAVLKEYLRVTLHYAKHWELAVDKEEEGSIKIGVEPNPMDIQTALEELSDIKPLNSQYILTLPNENTLKSEAKRLSLWLNFELNEQSIR